MARVVMFVCALMFIVSLCYFYYFLADIGSQKLEEKTSKNMMPTIKLRNDRVYPISFGLPSNRFRTKSNSNQTVVKKRDFSTIIPGYTKGKARYFHTEEEYYNQYSESYFGITFKKAGWDCFRHYEIIAAGGIPFFLDIDELPQNTMFDFPVDLIKKAMQLPGVPSIGNVSYYIQHKKLHDGDEVLSIDHDVFDVVEYNKIREKIYAYSIEKLTWSSKAKYVMQTVQMHYPCLAPQNQKILLVSIDSCEYMSCILWGGFFEVVGTERMSSLLGAKTALFRSLSPSASSLYGSGFSYKDAFDEWDEKKMRELTTERLAGGYFNVIIFMNGANGNCNMRDYAMGIKKYANSSSILYNYQKMYNPIVIVVDGNDIDLGCHTFFEADVHQLQYHLHFIREFNNTYHPNMKLPLQWTGCKSNSKANT
jgi:hypothetical protein